MSESKDGVGSQRPSGTGWFENDEASEPLITAIDRRSGPLA
jgi:hypothetical protein